jgi:hypothetical protein
VYREFSDVRFPLEPIQPKSIQKPSALSKKDCDGAGQGRG